MDEITVRMLTPRLPGERKKLKRLETPWVLHFMVLPAALLVFVFSYLPMSGIILAFQDYKAHLALPDHRSSD